MDSLISRSRTILSDVRLLFGFLRRRRSVWVVVLVAVLLAASLAMYVVQAMAVSPFVYPLF
jgi:hypothetical protein